MHPAVVRDIPSTIVGTWHEVAQLPHKKQHEVSIKNRLLVGSGRVSSGGGLMEDGGD